VQFPWFPESFVVCKGGRAAPFPAHSAAVSAFEPEGRNFRCYRSPFKTLRLAMRLFLLPMKEQAMRCKPWEGAGLSLRSVVKELCCGSFGLIRCSSRLPEPIHALRDVDAVAGNLERLVSRQNISQHCSIFPRKTREKSL
jgi:hypothetical protein